MVDDVDKIAKEFGYPKIPIYCTERLDDALKALDLAWDRTTGNIRENQNPGFKLNDGANSKAPWRLLYDSSEKM